mmetsp:Transcript_123555/g.331875  ORF Transcript_123555/g.331875 Transcript_123555/m.331875 type:complete len:358 (+) Transcript_123555:652-1725(+)
MAVAARTAPCAALASWMVASFFALSAPRSSSASFMAACSSETSCASCSMRREPSATVASPSSILAVRPSMSSWSLLRVFLLVPSSVSHQPLCSASSFASSIRRTMRSLIIFFTFLNGSSCARAAIWDSTRLPVCSARSCRYAAARPCASGTDSDRSAASEEAFVWSRAGRCFSALPCTAPLEMISMACAKASSSSARSVCRDSKSEAFCAQMAVRSSRYFLSAARVSVVSVRSALASAAIWRFFALNCVLSEMSALAWSLWAVMSCIVSVYAFFLSSSSFSSVVRSLMNLSSNLASISMMPCDWNSYPAASGAVIASRLSSAGSCCRNAAMALLASSGMSLSLCRACTCTSEACPRS